MLANFLCPAQSLYTAQQGSIATEYHPMNIMSQQRPNQRTQCQWSKQAPIRAHNSTGHPAQRNFSAQCIVSLVVLHISSLQYSQQQGSWQQVLGIQEFSRLRAMSSIQER